MATFENPKTGFAQKKWAFVYFYVMKRNFKIAFARFARVVAIFENQKVGVENYVLRSKIC